MCRKLYLIALILLLSSLLWSATPTIAEELETGKDRRTDGVTLSFETANQYVDLFTGSASYSIPIEVPPGPGGFAPSLALQYSSDARNGWMGLGWDIAGLHRIERSTRYGIPTYDDPVCQEYFGSPIDRFDMYLNGQHYQIIWDDDSGQYITDPFTYFKISYSCKDEALAEWTIVDKSGVEYTFKGIPAVGRSTGYRFYPVTQAVDPHGNLIRYEYNDKNDKDVNVKNGDYYPEKITYGLTNRPLMDINQITVSISFELEPRKIPVFNTTEEVSNFKGGSKMVMDRRIQYIKVWSTPLQLSEPVETHYPPIKKGLIRAYELKYEATLQGSQSLLTEVRTFGYVDYLSYKFSYQGQRAEQADLGFEETAEGIPNLWPLKSSRLGPINERGELYPGVRWVDINGDALTDMVWGLNNKGRHWDTSRVGAKAIAEKPLIWSPIGDSVEYYDLPLDQVTYDTEGFPAPISYWLDEYMGGYSYWHLGFLAGTDLIDVNNDGFIDIVHSLDYGRSWEWEGSYVSQFTWINDYGRGWKLDPDWKLPEFLVRLEACRCDTFKSNPCYGVVIEPVINNIKIVDVNGDGFPDIVSADKGTFLNKGAHGQKGWEKNPDPVWKTPASSFGYFGAIAGNERARYIDLGVRYVDFNGDGLNDVLLYSNPECRFEKVEQIDEMTTTVFRHLCTEMMAEIWINHGYIQDNGTAYKRVDWHVPTGFMDQFTLRDNIWGTHLGTQLLDINLDGLPDFVYSLRHRNGTTTKTIAFNTGNGWGFVSSNPRNPYGPNAWVDNLPDFAVPRKGTSEETFEDNGVSFADFNGDGAPDIGRSRYYYEALAGFDDFRLARREIGVWYNQFKPPLLVGVETPYGATIQYHYESSHSDGNYANHQDAYSVNRLPFPKQVVTWVELNDGIRNQVRTEFAYSGGLFDFQSHEFRGFRRVTVQPGGSNQPSTPAAQIVYSFYQDDARQGRIASIRTGNDEVYSEKINQYVFNKAGADARGSVYQTLLGTTYNLTYDSINARRDLVLDLNFDAPDKITLDPWMARYPMYDDGRGISWTKNQSIAGYSLLFEQDEDCVVVSPEKTSLSALTVQAWISPAKLETKRRQIILEKKRSLETERSFALFLDESNQLGVLYYGPKRVEINSGYKLPVNQFTHIALTYDGKATTRIFINGALVVESLDFTGPLSTDRNFYVGCPPYGPAEWSYRGLIDELKIFDNVVNVPKITKVGYFYDQYANPTRIYSYGDMANPEDDFITYTDFKYDTERHILNLPSYTAVREDDPHTTDNYTIKAANWYEYDDIGNLTKLVRWEGDRGSDGAPNKYSQKNPVAVFEYDTRGNLIKLIDPLKRETVFRYVSFFPFPTALRNALGQSQTIDYYGLDTKEQDYDRYLGLFGQVKRITDANGASIRYVYDRYGRLRAVYGPNDGDIKDGHLYPSLLYTYSLEPTLYSRGNLKHLKMYISARTEPLKSEQAYLWQFEDDLKNYGKTSLNISGSFFDNYLEAGGFPRNGLNNISSSVTYFDGFGRPLETIREAEPENTVVVSDITAFDELGRAKKIFKPFAHFDKNLYVPTQSGFANLSSGNIYQEPELGLPKVTVEYDPIGRITGSTGPDGARTIFKYDRWQVTATDPNGHETVSHYDAYGRLIKVEEIMPEGPVTTAYEYDILGNLIKVTYTGGHEIHFEYDALGRRKKMIDPDMGRGTSKYIFTPAGKAVELPSRPWEYSYDLAGNLVEITDAKGQRIRFEYDKLNRPVAKYYYEEVRVGGQLKTDIQTPVRWQYDDTAIGGPYAVGRLVQMTDPSGSTQYRYDNEGQVIQVKKTIDGQTYTAILSYDALGRLKSLTYPDNEVLEYVYGRDGQLKQVKNRAGLSYAKELLYDAVGNLRQITLGNERTTRYSYDDDGHQRLENITTSLLDGRFGSVSLWEYLKERPELTIQDIKYDYDPKGNITSRYATLTQPIQIRNLQRNPTSIPL